MCVSLTVQVAIKSQSSPLPLTNAVWPPPRTTFTYRARVPIAASRTGLPLISNIIEHFAAFGTPIAVPIQRMTRSLLPTSDFA
jgi:hypothetical protein